MDNITYYDLCNDFDKLGIKKGDNLNLKISLKSIGYIEGGANTVINALLDVIGSEGTIVSESFVNTFYFPRLMGKKALVTQKTASYAGAIANEMLKREDSYRSTHPIQKFVAIGKYAKYLTERHTPNSMPYNVLKELSELNGKNLRVGGLDKVVGVGTTHVAITSLGLRERRIKSGVKYINEKGEMKVFMLNWAGGCAKGFNNLMDIYKENGCIISVGFVGNAPSMITDMKKTLECEIELFSKNPKAFLCDDPCCVNCRMSWDFSDKKLLVFISNCIKEKKYKNLIKLLALYLYSQKLP